MDGICEVYYNTTLPSLYVDMPKQYEVVLLAIAITYYILALLAFLAFVWTKNWVVYSKQKSITAAFIYLCGLSFGVTSNILREGLGRDSFPCKALAWTHHLPVICLVSQPIGIIYFYIYKLRKERLKTQAIKKMFNEDIENRSSAGLDPVANTLLHRQKGKEIAQGIMHHIVDFLYVSKHSKDGRIVVGDENDPDEEKNNNGKGNHGDRQRISTLDVVPSSSRNLQAVSTSESEDPTMKRNSWKQTFLEQVGIPLMMLTVFGFPYPIAIAVRIHLDPIFDAGCVGCRLTYVDQFMKMASGGLFMPLALQGIYAMRNEPDPLRVITELKNAVMWAFIVMGTWVPSLVLSFLGTGDRVFLNVIETSSVGGAYYIYVVSGVVIAYFDRRRAQVAPAGKRVRTLSSSVPSKDHGYSVKNLPPPSALDLDLILLDPKARSALLEHSINEISSENVVFVFKLRAWKSIWEKEKPEKVSKVAERLFKDYISKECNAPINIPYKVFIALEKNIQAFFEDRAKAMTIKPNKDIFDACEVECTGMIEHDLLPRFCRSELFKKEIIEAGLLDKVLRQ